MWIATVLVLLLLLSLAVFSACVLLATCYTYEFKNWFGYKKERKKLEEKMTKMEADNKLLRIQQSTKTSFRWFIPVHDRLRMKYGWYYRWHMNPYANKVHMSFLTMLILAFFVGGFLGLFGGPYNYAQAADYTSSGTGNWDNAATWGGSGVPSSGDNVTISAGHTVTLTGEINIGAGNITVNGTLITGTYNVTCTDLTVASGGTLTATSSTFNIADDWSHAAGAFNSGSSKIVFTGTSPSIDAGGATTNKQIYAMDAIVPGQTLTLISRLYAKGTVTIGSVSGDRVVVNGGQWLDATNTTSPLVFQGSYQSGASTTGGYNIDTLVLDFYFSGNDISVPIPGGRYGGLRIRGGGNMTTILQGAVISSQFDLNQTTGTKTLIFDLNNFSLTCNGNFNVGTTTTNLYNKIIAKNSSVDVNGVLTINASDASGANELDMDTSTWNLSGNLTNNDTITADTSTFIFDSATANQTITTSASTVNNTFYNFTINKTGVNDDILLAGTMGLDVNNLLKITDGEYNPGAYNTTLAGLEFNDATNGSFTRGAGTVTFDGTGTWTDSRTNKADIGNISINGTGARLTLGSTVLATSVTVDADDYLNLGVGGYTLELSGAGTDIPTPLVASASSFEKGTDSTVKYSVLNSSGDVNIANVTYNSVELSPSSEESFVVSGDLTLTGGLTVSSNATFVLGSNDLAVANIDCDGTLNASGDSKGNITSSGTSVDFTNGTYTKGPGTFTLNGSSQAFQGNSNDFHFLTISGNVTQTGVTVADVFTVGVGGAYSLSGEDVTLSINSGGGIDNSGTLGLASDASNAVIQGVGGNFTYSGLDINWNGEAVTLKSVDYTTMVALYDEDSTINIGDNNVEFENVVEIGNGSAVNFNLNGYSVNYRSDLIVYSGSTYTPGAGTSVFSKGMGLGQTLTEVSTNQNLGNIRVSAFSGNTTLKLGSDIVCESVLIDDNQKIDATNGNTGNYNITTTGDWTNNEGTLGFTKGTGTVFFTKTSGTQMITGNTTFKNFTATSSSARTLQFAASSTTTITGTWTITGASGNLITLTSSSAPTAWNVNASTANVSYADVSYSNSTNSICAAYSVSTNNGNTNWQLSDGDSCNNAPEAPTSIEQYKSNGSTEIGTGSLTNETTVVFKGSISDDDASDQVKLQVEIQPINTAFTDTPTGTSSSYCTATCTATITISSGLANGTSYHWQARSIDDDDDVSAWISYGGNSDGTPPGTPAATDFTVDTSAPTVNITAPLAEAFVKGTTVITFTDSESTAPQCSINNINWSSCTSGSTTLSDITGFSGLADGAFTLYLQDTDAAENTGTDSEVDVIKDTTAPASTSITIAANYTKIPGISISLAATDITSGVNTFEISEDGGTVWGDPVAFTGSPMDYTYTITGNTGNKTISVRFSDNASNVSTATSDTIIYDTAGPTKPGTPVAAEKTNDTTPTWTWSASSDALSGVNSYSVRYGSGDWTSVGNITTWTSTTLTEGSYSLTVKAIDNATNESIISDAGTVLIDTTAPTISAFTINNTEDTITTSTSVTLKMTGLDDSAGLAQRGISNDGVNYSYENCSGDSCIADKPWTLLSGDGTKTIYLKLVDAAGNTSTVSSDTILLDSTGPGAFSLYSPADDYWTNATSVQLTWEAASDLGSGLQKYQLYFDDSLLDGNISSSVTSYDLTDLTLGQHTWQVKAIDNLGNETSSEKRTFGIDQSSPTIPSSIRATNLSNSELSLTKNSPVVFEWDVATDQGAGVNSYLVYIGSEPGKNDIINGEEVPTNRYEAELTIDGYYYFSVKAKGKAGNLSAISSEYKVRFDSSAPAAITKAVVFDVSNRVTGSYAAYIAWTPSSDAAGEGMKEYAVYLANEKVGTVSQESSRYFVKTELTPGRYVFKVSGIDLAGNESAFSPEASLEISAKESNTLSITNIKSTPSKIVDPDNGNTSVLINWKTNSLATSVVEVEGKNYGEEDLSKLNTGHGVLISGLKASTSYQYKVISRDIYGNNISSESNIFRTNGITKKQSTLEIIIRSLRDVFSLFTKASAAALEKIGLLKPTQISKEGLIVYNVSDSELNSYNAYISLSKSGQTIEKSEDGKNFVTLATPTDNYYVDQNLVQTKTYYYRTKGNDGVVSIRPDNNDTEPPEIINPKVIEEATQLSDDKAMVAISWQTNRPSTSQVIYGPGDPSMETEKEESLNSSHLVILDGLQAGTEYKYKVKSTADNGVGAESINLVFKTPQKVETQSVLEIIIKQFQDIIAKFSSWFRS